MIRIALSQAAYEAIERTLALGSVGYEAQRSDTGKVFIWLDRWAMNRLEAERLRGEDLSDTIIRLAGVGHAALNGSS
jgi:hypothetical protein